MDESTDGGRGQRPDADDEEVGTVREEAARLLDAVTEAFAGSGHAPPTEQPRDPGDGGAPGDRIGSGLSDLLGDALGALREVDAHVATGGEDCRYCPVCRAIHHAREASPELRHHVVTAARSLLAAGTALVDHLDPPKPPDPHDPPEPPDPDRPHDRGGSAGTGAAGSEEEDDR